MSDEDLNTNNITIDESGKSVTVRVNPKLYKVHVIMRAADELIDDNHIIINGDPEKSIIVKFISKKDEVTREELLKTAYEFNTLLVAISGKG
ncbi:MAG: hypothetical protein DRO90_01605 [Candidatus Altiarchaeales archaeon]|nr:MAG: hypothetical protein DRO95_00050 [Candidatus Altiarchaeales archaeon]RLI94708.1 MAG: hypothetical protein DRO90_01605 [Candidatus Altiarchaeales archaeon]RLI94756.1 MAG: hypothetical protein DRO94_02150 [Candidatus Altiarchaeales archaeon]HDO82807.1 hypothetical protein [Candidatus Altiarchaeales archaeon]HEX55456.1 hypothetical protein [Candidatus Altiarchaeales archaeon]